MKSASTTTTMPTDMARFTRKSFDASSTTTGAVDRSDADRRHRGISGSRVCNFFIHALADFDDVVGLDSPAMPKRERLFPVVAHDKLRVVDDGHASSLGPRQSEVDHLAASTPMASPEMAETRVGSLGRPDQCPVVRSAHQSPAGAMASAGWTESAVDNGVHECIGTISSWLTIWAMIGFDKDRLVRQAPRYRHSPPRPRPEVSRRRNVAEVVDLGIAESLRRGYRVEDDQRRRRSRR